MADPVSIFPLFTRNQAFPPSVEFVQNLDVAVGATSVAATPGPAQLEVTVEPASIVAGG